MKVKRVLKWVGLVLGVVVLVPLLALAGVWGCYKSIVLQTPRPAGVSGEFAPLVNVFAGTGGIPYMCAYDTPAAQTPFGMVRIGPDTASILVGKTVLNASGYYYGDNRIIGFSHTRLVGADSREGGHFRVLPATDKVVEKAREGLWRGERGNRRPYAKFSHRDECASPGSYSVRLYDGDVTVELTATPRTGAHRYTFSEKVRKPHLLLDVTSMLGDRDGEGEVRVLPASSEVEGKARTQGSFSGRYGGIDVYFVARFSKPFAEYGTWTREGYKAGASEAGGSGIGADVAFACEGGSLQVEMRLGLSYVSVENARANLEAESAGRGFDGMAATARVAWEEMLNRIRVKGGTDEQRRVFYTSLYRGFQMPTTFCDVNGEYTGFDKKTHKAEGFTYYTDFSLWDTFRTVQPLYNLVARGEQRDMMRSLVEMAKAGGCLPRWPSGCGYTNCMFGTPADVAVSEAWLKGVRDFDMETAYACMRQTGLTGKPESSEFGGRNALEDYIRFGYVPSDKANKAVSATLEYAWSDHALSLLAHELGHEDDAAVFAQHAQSWKNLWDAGRQFFVPRDSAGAFAEEFNPYIQSYIDSRGKYTKHYVEGSAMQWRWGVPFDMQGLVDTFKSREYFVSELESYFAKSRNDKGGWNPGPYYWQGNEPFFHAAYLFNSAGRPDLTQKWVRWIINTKYGDDYVGMDGNDDGGTTSAWYVWSALGLYPIAGTTRYQLGAPLFEEAEVKIGENVLKIVAENYSPERFTAKSVSLNGKPLDRTWITHDEIAAGGEIRFTME